MLDPARMFLDYCPWPAKVRFVDSYEYHFAVRNKACFGGYEARRIELNLYVYGKWEVQRAYGWEPDSRTVLIYYDGRQ